MFHCIPLNISILFISANVVGQKLIFLILVVVCPISGLILDETFIPWYVQIFAPCLWVEFQPGFQPFPWLPMIFPLKFHDIHLLWKFHHIYYCMNVWMYECMNVCMYVCVCVCMYVCLSVCMSVCLSVRMYVCMYMYVCMFVCNVM